MPHLLENDKKGDCKGQDNFFTLKLYRVKVGVFTDVLAVFQAEGKKNDKNITVSILKLAIFILEIFQW